MIPILRMGLEASILFDPGGFWILRELCVKFVMQGLAQACVLLEQTGAAPILADGLVAGNCSALLQGKEASRRAMSSGEKNLVA